MKEFFEILVQNSIFFSLWNTIGAAVTIGILIMLILIVTSSIIDFSLRVKKIWYPNPDIEDIIIFLISLFVIVLFIAFIIRDFINRDKNAVILFCSCIITGKIQVFLFSFTPKTESKEN